MHAGACGPPRGPREETAIYIRIGHTYRAVKQPDRIVKVRDIWVHDGEAGVAYDITSHPRPGTLSSALSAELFAALYQPSEEIE